MSNIVRSPDGGRRSVRSSRRLRPSLAVAATGAVLAAILAWNPVVGHWHLSRGRTLLAERDPAEALRHLEAAERRRPSDPEIQFLMSRAFRRLEDFEEFERRLSRAERLGLNSEQAGRERTLAAAQAGRLSGVESELPRLLQSPGEDGREICEAYVRGYFANLRLQEALTLIDAWAADYPDDPQPDFMRGYAYEAMSDHRRSADHYREGLSDAPDRSDMRRRLAEVLTVLGETEAASAEYRRCLHDDAGDTAASIGLAGLLFRRGEPDAAEAALAPVLERLTDGSSAEVEAESLAGEVALARGRYEQAVSHLTRASEIEPYDTKVRYSLAKALNALGRKEEATVHFDYVAEAEAPLNRMELQLAQAIQEPRNAELRFEIASTMMKYSDPDAAARWYRSVLELDPEHAAARQALNEYRRSRRSSGRPRERTAGAAGATRSTVAGHDTPKG